MESNNQIRACNKCKMFLSDYIHERINVRGTYDEFVRKPAIHGFVNEWVSWTMYLMERLTWAQFLSIQSSVEENQEPFEIFNRLLQSDQWIKDEFEYLRTRMIEEGAVNLKIKECPFRVIEFYLADIMPIVLRHGFETHYCHSHPEVGSLITATTPSLSGSGRICHPNIIVAVPLQEDEEDLYA
jgi:hypothetical protein